MRKTGFYDIYDRKHLKEEEEISSKVKNTFYY